MIPLDFFTEFSQACDDRPFLLLEKEQQEKFVNKTREVTAKLKKALEDKKLQKSHAYQIVTSMGKAVEGKDFDEVGFSSALAQLDTLYGPETKPDFLEKVKEMDKFAERFKRRAHEFFVLEEKVKQASKDLTPEQIKAHDLEVLQNVGIFYVLEYTLILEQEMLKHDPEQQAQILEYGANVEAGNLPGLKPLIKSFYQEFAFNLYNKEVRWQVLKIFFDFQALLETNDIGKIMTGLRQLNLGLLKVCINGGLELFAGKIYKPFEKNTSLKDILEYLKAN